MRGFISGRNVKEAGNESRVGVVKCGVKRETFPSGCAKTSASCC